MNQNTARKMSPSRTDSVARLRERKRRKQRQRRNRKIFLVVFTFLLCSVSFWLGRITAPKVEKQGEKGGGSQTAAAKSKEKDGTKAVSTLTDGNTENTDMTLKDMEDYIQNHPEEYPQNLKEFLESTPEAVDFVFHYPQYKDQAAGDIDISGDYKEGEIPLFIQWDKRWGYEVYGDDMMALSGCGPACLSMVYVGLTGDTSMNPKAMSEYASENGYYLENVGTSWELMSYGAESLGLSWSNPSLSKQQLFAELDAGHPLICSMSPGDFTTTGHFIVIYGRKGDNLLIHDPNSLVRSSQEWPYDQVEKQIKNVWSYQKNAASGQKRAKQLFEPI
ncbi:MAG: secreted protein containing domain of murein hydrolase [Lachnospiraceae bacterium]|nr:secreted protein containing domain of murein hydrolase [Lachnospiraceae bacterium]